MPDTVLEFEKKQAKKKTEAKRKVSSSDTGESDQEDEEDEGEESEEIVDYELQAWWRILSFVKLNTVHDCFLFYIHEYKINCPQNNRSVRNCPSSHFFF